MKKRVLNILLVVAFAALSVFLGYLIAENNPFAPGVETTHTKQAVTEKEGKRILLAEDNDKDYHFYAVGTKLVLVHSDKEYEYDDVLSDAVYLDKPVLSVIDINSDGVQELLLQVGAAKINEEVYHSVYGFSYYSNETDDGYKLTAVTESSISALFDRMIQVQMTQDEKCPKNCLFAMSGAYGQINFNRETGIPEDNYYYMFKASQDKDGNYMTLLSWSKDKINCSISDSNPAYTDIIMPVRISYKETKEIYNTGYVVFQVYISEKGNIGIVSKSMEFCAYKDYGVYKYNFDEKEDSAWSSVVNNSNTTVPTDRVIDFIQYNPVDFTAQVSTDNFARNDSDLNGVLSVRASESCIELTAKPGCSFSEDIISNKQYSINLYSTKNNTINTYDISYAASVYTDGNKNQVLRIDFDKKYRQNLMKQIAVNFGVK